MLIKILRFVCHFTLRLAGFTFMFVLGANFLATLRGDQYSDNGILPIGVILFGTILVSVALVVLHRLVRYAIKVLFSPDRRSLLQD